MASAFIESLLDAQSPRSSTRWIAIRSAQTLGVIATFLTMAVGYQVVRSKAIDPQLSFLCNGVYYAVALLAGASVWKRGAPAVPPIMGPSGAITETITKKTEVARELAPE